MPPVPVEDIAERLLDLSIVRDEEIEEAEGEVVLGCIRPGTKEIVLNQRHAAAFEQHPGRERYTIGHEIGHADVYGEVAVASQHEVFRGLAMMHTPKKSSATRGTVQVVRAAFTPQMAAMLARCTPDVKAEVLPRLRDAEVKAASGADSPLVRRAVEHYAATLLMPRDLLTAVIRDEQVDLTAAGAISRLARRFVVSWSAMRIQLEELGLIHGIDESTGRVLLEDPRQRDQMKLF
jgi:hypothetical protein